MNKNLFKSLQVSKQRELNNLQQTYLRMNQFFIIAVRHQKSWTLKEYDCFWSWYYHSDIDAYEALEKVRGF